MTSINSVQILKNNKKKYRQVLKYNFCTVDLKQKMENSSHVLEDGTHSTCITISCSTSPPSH